MTENTQAAVATPPAQVQPEASKDKQMAFIVYILYFAGFFIGLSAIAGVIIAHLKVKEASPAMASHFQYQIRTFWFGLLALVIGGFTVFFLIGYLVLLAWAVWTLVRCIKGIMRANEDRAIDNPTTLLW